MEFIDLSHGKIEPSISSSCSSSNSFLSKKNDIVNIKDTDREVEGKNEAPEHSFRKLKKVRCDSCDEQSRCKLRSCIICLRYKCKNCIKKDNCIKTTKKLRNPSLYICKSCLVNQVKDRIKQPKDLLAQNGNNLAKINRNKPKHNNSLIGEKILPRQMIPHKYVKCSHGSIVICQSCGSAKESMIITRTFFELLLNSRILYESNTPNGLLLNKQLINDFPQTVNPGINPQLDFIFETPLILCKDCFRSYLGIGTCLENRINQATNRNIENMLSKQDTSTEQVHLKNSLEEMKAYVSIFFENFSKNQILFEATLNQFSSKIMQDSIRKSNWGIINNLNTGLTDSTMILDSINKISILLIQELNSNIERIMANINQSSNSFLDCLYQPKLQAQSQCNNDVGFLLNTNMSNQPDTLYSLNLQ